MKDYVGLHQQILEVSIDLETFELEFYSQFCQKRMYVYSSLLQDFDEIVL